MDYKVSLSARAVQDLRSIVSYIEKEHPGAAKRMGHALLEKAKSIGKFPRSGRIVPEFHSEKIRELILKPYRIIYRINEQNGKIEISRFWHSSRGFPLF